MYTAKIHHNSKLSGFINFIIAGGHKEHPLSRIVEQIVVAMATTVV